MVTQVLPSRAPLGSVTETVTRGQLLKNRRIALGIFTAAEFARRSGKSRNTIEAAERDRASEATYNELDAFLRTLAEQARAQVSEGDSPTEDNIEFDITGPSTAWHVVVRGPVDRADELRRQVAELLHEIDGTA